MQEAVQAHWMAVVSSGVAVLLVREVEEGSESRRRWWGAVGGAAATARARRWVVASANTVACASHCGSTRSCAWWRGCGGTAASGRPPSSPATRPPLVAAGRAFAVGRHCCLPCRPRECRRAWAWMWWESGRWRRRRMWARDEGLALAEDCASPQISTAREQPSSSRNVGATTLSIAGAR